MIELLGLQITEKCNRNCLHCCGSYGPITKKGKEMPLSIAKDYIYQLPEYEVQKVTISGGEPTLYRDLDEIIISLDESREQTGYPKEISMVTNSSWAKSFKPSINKICEWGSLGLDNLSLSYDNFRIEDDKISARGLAGFYNRICRKRKNFWPKIELQTVNEVVPLGRARKLPNKTWRVRYNSKELFPCSIDGWARWSFKEYVKSKGENIEIDDGIKKAVLISPEGLYLCDCATNVIKMGDYREPLDVVEP
ncbi:MAG: radical SAM protein, partial [archaeon]